MNRTLARCGWLTMLLLQGGCAMNESKLTPAERGQLQDRAMSLLLRAAESNLDVVACNAIEALVDVSPERGLPAFRAALQSPSPLVRFGGCAAVGTIRDKPSRPAIARCLQDEQPRVRLAAAMAAYRLGAEQNAQILLDTLSTETDENLRSDAAYLIGRLGDRAALPRLKNITARESSNRVLVHLFTARAMLGDNDALDALTQYTRFDSVSRLIALQSLVEIGSERSRDVLQARFRDPEDYVQSKLIAARGLGKLGSAEGFDLAAQSLTFTHGDDNERMRVRSLAALALGAIGDPRALPGLKLLAETETDERTQVAAATAICQIMRGRK